MSQIFEVYSLRDVKVGKYALPVCVEARGAVVRELSALIRQKGNSDIQNYPADFQLFFLGKFDNETGKFALLANPEFVLTVSDLLPVAPPQEITPGVPLKSVQAVS